MPKDHVSAETRRDLLEILHASDRPMHPVELATRLGLHPTTVRRHLELLESIGSVRREPEDRGQPGRPRVVYEAVEGHCGTPVCEGTRFLARMLTGYLDANHDDPEKAGLETGEEWGRHLVGTEPFRHLGHEEALGRTFAVLDQLGYQPSRHEEADTQITTTLGKCPFPELAETHPEVICNLHLGLIRGALAGLGADLTVAGFSPAGPQGECMLLLRRPA